MVAHWNPVWWEKQDEQVQTFGTRQLQRVNQAEHSFVLLDQEEDKRRLCSQVGRLSQSPSLLISGSGSRRQRVHFCRREHKEVSRSRLALLNNFELDLLARPQGGNAGIQVSRIQMHNNYNVENGYVKRIAKSNLVNCDLKLSGTVSWFLFTTPNTKRLS